MPSLVGSLVARAEYWSRFHTVSVSQKAPLTIDLTVERIPS